MEVLRGNIANRAALAAIGGALVLSACSPESAPPQVPELPLVEQAAAIPTYGSLSPIDMRSIDQSIDAFYRDKNENPYTTLVQTNPKTGEATRDLPGSSKTAPILTISLGGDKLRYEDSTPGLITAERQILGAVAANSTVLTAAMKSGSIHTLKIRAFESKQKSSISESSKPMLLPQDATDDRKNNLYYFLPVDKPLDQDTIATMLGHESMHAALNHVSEQLTPERRQTLEKACGTLKQSALEDIASFSALMRADLVDLWRGAPAGLKSHYLKVMKALEDGTYDQLPVNRTQLNVIPACFIDRPQYVITKLAEQHGQSDLLNSYYADKQASALLGQLEKSWLGVVNNHTIYGALREAAYLPLDEDNASKGHPEDGHFEIEGSIANLTLTKSKEFGQKVRLLKADEQAAIVELGDMNVEALKKVAASDADRAEIDKRYETFKTALR